MIGPIYEQLYEPYRLGALPGPPGAAAAGDGEVEIEDCAGGRGPLRAERWFHPIAGDESLLERCRGAVLDVGSGPGRLTVALTERGQPALGIDLTPGAVHLTHAAGAMALCRDVYGRVPGAGRWDTVVLADGNVGIGGDPVRLLLRVRALLAATGRALVEMEGPGRPTRRRTVRLRLGDRLGDWFAWAEVGCDQIVDVGGRAGLAVTETWAAGDRWFAALRPASHRSRGRR